MAGFLPSANTCCDPCESSTRASINLTDVIADLIASRFGPVSVVSEGADPTGVLDSTAAFVAARNALPLGYSDRYNRTQRAGVILVPPGRYKVTNFGLTSGIILRGCGRDSTVLVNTSTTQDCINLSTQAYPTVVHHIVQVEDLSIEGSQTATAGAAINIDGGADQNTIRAIFRNVWVAFGYHGFRLRNTIGVIADGCETLSCRGNGFEQVGTMNAATFSSCGAYGSVGHGYNLSPSYCSLTSCYAESNTGNGFNFFIGAAYGGTSTSLVDCGAENNTGHGFALDTSRGISLINPYCAGNGGDGIRNLGCRSCSFLGVTVDTGTGYGLYEGNGSAGAAPTGNILTYFLLSSTAGAQNASSSYSQLATQGDYQALWGSNGAGSPSASIRWSGGTGEIMSRGKVIARQNVGTAGVDEVQIYHDGSDGHVESKDGELHLRAATAIHMQATSIDQGGRPDADATYDRGTASYRDRVHWVTRFPIVKKSSIQTLAAAGNIARLQGIARVAGSGGAVTLTSTPTIEATGLNDGEELVVQGTSSANTITVQDNGTLAGSNLRLSTNTFTLTKGAVLRLIYDSTDGFWYEISRSTPV